jgi:cytidylate kinase
MKKIIIAIDGPSGSGKSTTAKNIAKELGIEYIDTGAMYRAAALQAKLKNVPVEEDAVGEMLDKTDIDFMEGQIFLNGREVDDQIRNLEISALASQISKLVSCRTKLVEIQRRIAKAKSIVMDGRDIGSNVLPDAEFKFYLTASIDIRAKRRWQELQEQGENVSLEDVKADIEKRDHDDMTRELNPLIKAEGAVEISTDDHSIEEMTEIIKSYVVKKK